MNLAGSQKIVIPGDRYPESDVTDHELTLVIPAYNEESRLPKTLADTKSYLDAWGLNYRVLVVDDGSQDSTATLAAKFGRRFSTICQPNGGKGSAVRNGMLAARGRIVAFTDADLPYDLAALKSAYDIIVARKRDVVFGSRTMEGAGSHVERRWMRTVASSAFRTLMRLLVSRKITDTQCGLKVFSQRAAQRVFSRTTIDGFAFDAEVVYLTHLLNLSFETVPVTLINEYSSTISLARNAIPMLLDVVRVRIQSIRGMYRANIDGPNIGPCSERGQEGGVMPVSADLVNRVAFHADDFGMNAAVNQGILISFRQGLLTSTSLLANAPATEAACGDWPALIDELNSAKIGSYEARRELGDPSLPFDFGIHLNLTQGHPLTGDRYPATFLDKKGNFPGIGSLFYRMNRASAEQLAQVAAELQAQIERMCDSGHRPTHLNGHQYIELIPAIGAMIPDMLRRYSIPVVRVAYESGLARSVLLQGKVAAWGLGLIKQYYARVFSRRMHHAGVAFPDRFFGTAHAGRVDLGSLSTFLEISRKSKFTEIGLHPGIESTGGDTIGDPWFDPLQSLRSGERDCLCSTDLHDKLIAHKRKLGRLQLLRDTVY